MKNLFEIAAGSIVGTDHLGTAQVLLGKNNQDAYQTCVQAELAAAVVCDGCGTGRHSEFGAQFAAKFLAQRLMEIAKKFGQDPFGSTTELIEGALESARQDLLAYIRVLAKSMGGSLSETVNDYFLFTVMVAIATKQWALIAAIGDGLYQLNGKTYTLDSGPENMPIYPAYALTGSSVIDANPDLAKFKIHRMIGMQYLHNLAIASDGASGFEKIRDRNVPGKSVKAGDLKQFFDDRYFENPDNLRRRLVLLNSRKTRLDEEKTGLRIEEGLLTDDTTIVVIRRRPKKGESL